MAKVTLAKAHMHGGQEHPPGATLDLTPDQIERLRRFDKIDGGPGAAAIESIQPEESEAEDDAAAELDFNAELTGGNQ